MIESSEQNGLTPLSSVDWRFLLPAPPPGGFRLMVVPGASVALAERIKEVGLAREVSPTMPSRGGVDALVLLPNAEIDLREARSRLTSEGILHWQIDRRLPGRWTFTPGKCRSLLRSMNLQSAGAYAALPDFGSSKMYLPLEIPEALRWFVKTQLPVFTPSRRAIEWAALAATRLQNRALMWLTPCYCVTATSKLNGNIPPSFLGAACLPFEFSAGKARPIILSHAGHRVVFLPFVSGCRHPLAVLKVPKVPSLNDRTENEQTVLSRVHSQLDSPFSETIPRPLGAYRCGEITVSAESWLPGCSILRSSGRWGTPLSSKLRDLSEAAEWLTKFHYQTQIERVCWGKAAYLEWIERPLLSYEKIFGVTHAEALLFDDVSKYCRALSSDCSFPIVWQHRDFNVWNVFRSADQLAVIDWEGARPGLPLCDLFHFVTHWFETAFHLRKIESQVVGFRKLFFEHPSHGGPVCVAHRLICSYVEQLEIDARLCPLLLIHTWIELALRRAAQQEVLGETSRSSRDANRNLPFIEVLSEHRHQLLQPGRWRAILATDNKTKVSKTNNFSRNY